MNKWSNELTIFKERSTKANKHMKKYLISLVIKEMQIKTTLRFHLTPVIMAILKNTTTNVDEKVGQRNSYTLLVRM
jgi:hypothetical protein